MNNIKEIVEDHHIFKKRRYKNIFELRHTKLRFFVKKLPKEVKNCIIIRYEDLINNFDKTMRLHRPEFKMRQNLTLYKCLRTYIKI